MYALYSKPRDGIIPARAGFTFRCAVVFAARRDHPRSRGVYERLPITLVAEWGSSPLARGLRTTVKRWVDQWLDHPRSRGVYRALAECAVWTDGSSPLARGLRETLS